MNKRLRKKIKSNYCNLTRTDLKVILRAKEREIVALSEGLDKAYKSYNKLHSQYQAAVKDIEEQKDYILEIAQQNEELAFLLEEAKKKAEIYEAIPSWVKKLVS